MLWPTKYLYIYNTVPSKHFISLRTTIDRGSGKVSAPGRVYAVGLEGEVGRKRTLFSAKKRVRELIERYPSHKVTMRAFEKEHRVDQVTFVSVTAEPPLKDTPGVEGIDRFVTWLENEVKNGRLTTRRYAGICVCKHTASGGHSDHADCAAIDVFGSNEDMATMRDVAIAESDYFHTKYAILFKRIHFPDGTDRYYTGEWHSHLHLSVEGGVYNSACR